MVIDILIKFQEHSPLKYSLIRNSLSLVPKTIEHQSEESCLKFRSLADNLYSLDKITAQVADNGKNRFDKFIEAASFGHKGSFLKFNFADWLIFSKRKPVRRPMVYLQDHIYTVQQLK